MIETDVVMISGKQGSGKSTLARELIKLLNDQYDDWVGEEITFAGPLYEMHDLCRQVLKNYGIIPPHEIKDGNLLQLLGTEWARNTIDQEIWIKCLKNRVIELANMHTHFNHSRVTFIVPDCRFKNEFHSYGDALKVRLRCSEGVRKSRAEMWRDKSKHQSETDLDLYDASGFFDAVFDTAAMRAPEIAREIHELLLDKAVHSQSADT